jgi:hypothetical protein
MGCCNSNQNSDLFDAETTGIHLQRFQPLKPCLGDSLDQTGVTFESSSESYISSSKLPDYSEEVSIESWKRPGEVNIFFLNFKV